MSTRAWTFQANEVQPVRERLSWLTDIMSSRDGTEERRQVRHGARRRYEMLVTVDGYEAQRLDAFLYGYDPAAGCWFPAYNQLGLLSAAAAGGATTLQFDTTNRDYASGGYLMVVDHDSGDYQVCQMTAVSAASVDITPALSSAWAESSRVYPVYKADIVHPAAVDQITAAVEDITVAAEMVTPGIWTQDAGAITYRTEPVFPFGEPDRGPTISARYRRLTRRLDYDIGSWSQTDPAGQPFGRRQLEYLVEGRADLWAWRQWLAWARGQLKEWWIPTHQCDLTLLDAAASADTAIHVTPVGWQTHFAGRLGRTDLDIKLVDGTHIRRGVLSNTMVSATKEALNLDAALGQDIDPSTVSKISWLEKCRLATDVVEIVHYTQEVAHISLQVTTVNS